MERPGLTEKECYGEDNEDHTENREQSFEFL